MFKLPQDYFPWSPISSGKTLTPEKTKSSLKLKIISINEINDISLMKCVSFVPS